MTKTAFPLTLLAATLVCALHAEPTQAQPVWVFVPRKEVTAIPAPSRRRASTSSMPMTVAAGGEIDVLNPAEYGMLTITKAISIQGHGFSGIGVATGGMGITINGAATDAVNLNGLLIEGLLHLLLRCPPCSFFA